MRMNVLKNRDRGRVDMTQGPILRNLLLFSVPMMLSGVLQLFFSAADISVAGRYLGDGEMAAIGAASTLITLLVNLFVGLSVGVSVSLGRAYGSGEHLTARRVVHTAMVLALVWGAAISSLGFLGATTLLELMDVPTHLLPMASTYLRIYACGLIGSSLFNFGSAVLRATGETRQPLYCLAVSCGLNFVLNQIFVRVCGMELEGVAWATAVSLIVMGLMTVVFMLRNGGPAQFSFRHLQVHWPALWNILGLGIPAGLQGIFFPLSNIVLQKYINTFGETVIAANSAACNIESFVYQALNGVYHACMAFVSCNMGAGNWRRVRAVFLRSLGTVLVTGLVLGLGMVALGHPLLSIYTNSPAVVEQAMLRFLFTGIPYFLCGLLEVVVGALRGLGSSVLPMIISVLGICGVRIAWVLTVFPVERFHTLECIYLSYPLSWAVALLAQSIWLPLLTKKLRKQMGIPLYLFKSPKED